jgi:hypothetical protein
MMRITRRFGMAVAVLSLVAGAAGRARADIAAFGSNASTAYLNSQGFVVTTVTDAQLATAGFLDNFDAFYFTRDGTSFGTGLSAQAAINVAAYVELSGDVVLLNGDFADGAGSDSYLNQLFTNAANFATAGGHGFIGEFNGAVSALTSNSDGFTPLDLIAGSAGPLGFGSGGSAGSITLTAAGLSHSVTSGLAVNYNPAALEFGAALTGVASPLILATYDNGNAAIIARSGAVTPAAVPEASTFVLAGTVGFIGLGVAWRRRKRAAA